MMLQLVQSPSQRVQRLIKNCSDDKEATATAMSTNKSSYTGDIRATSRRADDSNDYDDQSDQGVVETRKGSSSEVDEDQPSIMRVSKLVDRDGNIVAASSSSYSSGSAPDQNNDENDNVDDDQ